MLPAADISPLAADGHPLPPQVRAAYAEKYPEEYAEFESIMTGKLPANWAEKLPKFTAEGEMGEGAGHAEGQRDMLSWGP